MSAVPGQNPLVECNHCNAKIDRRQYLYKKGLCFECRKEQRKQEELIKKSDGDHNEN